MSGKQPSVEQEADKATAQSTTADEVTANNPEAIASNETISLPISEYERLRAELKAAGEKAESQWDVAVRAKAEVENIRRRAERDVANAHKYSVDKILTELLPVLDSLGQALQAFDKEGQADSPMREGTVLTMKMFEEVLLKFGVVEINPAGEVFNPELHEAMAMIENQEVKPGTIIEVFQKGYQLHGRLVRAARVVVSKAS